MLFINRQNKKRFFYLTLTFLLCGSCPLTVACQTKEQKTAAALKRCQSLLDQDDIKGASNCYAEAVAADPENGGEISKAGEHAVFEKCVSFKKSEDYKNAIICFDGFIALEPEAASVYFYLGNSYYNYFEENKKNTGLLDFELLDRAEQAIKTGLKIKPNDAAAHSYYGEILKDRGDKYRALAEHQIATKLSPKTSIFWIYLARVQESLMQDDEAIASYKQALIIDPNDTDSLYFMGLQYERMKRPNEALETYEKILKIEPSDEEILQKVKNLKEQIGLQRPTQQTKSKVKEPKKKGKATGVPNGASDLN